MGLSKDASQRDVQTYIVTLAALAVISLIVVAVPALQYTIEHSGQDAPAMELPLPRVRAVMGGLATLVSLRLLWLVWKHRSAIQEVRTLRGTYFSAGAATVALSIPGFISWLPTGLGVTVVGALAIIATALVPRVPKEQQTWPSDFRGF